MHVHLHISHIMVTNINVLSSNRNVTRRHKIRDLRPISAQVTTGPSRLFTYRALHLLHSTRRHIVWVTRTVRVISGLLMSGDLTYNSTGPKASALRFLSRAILRRLLNASISTTIGFLAQRVGTSLRNKGRVPMVQRTHQVQPTHRFSSLGHTSNTSEVIQVRTNHNFEVLYLRLIRRHANTFSLFAFLRTFTRL